MDIIQWIMLINDLTIDDCKLVFLPKDQHVRGNLNFIESMKHVPFDIKRVFYIYDIPVEAKRGDHANHNLHQFLICLAGSFDVVVKDTKPDENIFNEPTVVWVAHTYDDMGIRN